MRKGHGSTKVPGVKLRPQALKASSSKTNKSGPAWLNPEDDGITEQVILKSSKKPFVGIILCASGVPEKSALFRQATELGAQTSSDLTDIVTHLLSVGPGSPKYSYCVRHGVPIMHPSWITEAHRKWLDGEEVDPHSTMPEHRLPVFTTTTLSVTGIPDLQLRGQIQHLTKEHGGQFVKDIGANLKVTHLVCGGDRGADVDERGWSKKMQYVERYNALHDVKVQLVWEEWFWDCLEFGGQLDEASYNVNKPRPKRKLRRDNTPLLQPISSLADTARKGASIATPVEPENLDAEEVVTGKKIPGSSTRVFEGLLRNRGFEVKSGKLVRSPSKVKATDSRPSVPPMEEASVVPSDHSKGRNKTEAALTAFRRTKSFATSAPNASELTNVASSSNLQRATSSRQDSSLAPRSLAHPNAESTTSTLRSEKSANTSEPKRVPVGERHLFIGYKLCFIGEAKTEQVENEIRVRGGTVVSNKLDADFIVVRLSSGKRLRDEETLESLRARFRTECWLEHCIFEERICESSEHVAFAPLDVETPFPSAGSLRVHISGYPTNSKTFLIRLLRTIGVPITEQLTRRVTHMITCSNLSAKFAKAQEWGVPCVADRWLFDSVKAGEVKGSDAYVLKSDEDSQRESSSGGPIRDITNEEAVQSTSFGASQPLSKQPSLATEICKAASPSKAVEVSWNPTGLLSSSANDETKEENLASSSPADTLSASKATEPLSSLTDLQLSSAGSKPPSSARGLNCPSTSITDDTTVPSSATPSPVKLPSTSSFSSPTKQSTNALKSAITSLLGKRHSSEDQDPDPNTKASSGSRSSKRAKPPPRSKSKPTSSSKLNAFDSTNLLERQSTAIDYPLFTGEDAPQLPIPFDQGNPAEDTMRVTYEDPGQTSEKLRLMRLLTNGGLDSEEAEGDEKETKPLPTKRGRNLVRKSTRT